MKRLFNALPVFVLCAIILAPISAFAQASAADAAPFMGNWTLKFKGSQGPVDIKIKVSADGGTVAGELTSPTLGTAKSTAVTKGADGLILKFDVQAQGMPLNIAITLMPDGSNFKANLQAMDGEVNMPGEATKG